MLELIKKSLMASLGAAVVTKERVEKATRELVEEGKLSREEAEKLAEELIESGEKHWEEVQGSLSESVKKAVDRLDLARRHEVQALKDRLDNLEARLAMLEARKTTEETT
ncbi:Polyhydroxyalkanoate synthesis regulator phasin [Desulfacinum hydrothermale DSM 13146]|uniref:Polyhydroxyalkanoate synthesis regulator phasin n=1 Tax=Desulfacinum hydrothermale DSM 13146 TaxID=1121390 RepID=A0A1W1WXG9_9BACT|nr:phasin family protein [Desulfacinum hydrothermale]SMC16293.1 Polyhydroxyalkanoate synthesis regulator phasin [Desulfacinum hydrothermale DSM 13146]